MTSSLSCCICFFLLDRLEEQSFLEGWKSLTNFSHYYSNEHIMIMNVVWSDIQCQQKWSVSVEDVVRFSFVLKTCLNFFCLLGDYCAQWYKEVNVSVSLNKWIPYFLHQKHIILRKTWEICQMEHLILKIKNTHIYFSCCK